MLVNVLQTVQQTAREAESLAETLRELEELLTKSQAEAATRSGDDDEKRPPGSGRP